MIPETPPAVNSDPRAWLEHFPATRRSAIANFFHHAVRGGATTPGAVIQQVQHTIQRRLQWATPHTDVAHLLAVSTTLQEDRAGALAYAQYVIAYEQLPYESSTTTRIHSRWVIRVMRRLRCERYAAWFLCW